MGDDARGSDFEVVPAQFRGPLRRHGPVSPAATIPFRPASRPARPYTPALQGCGFHFAPSASRLKFELTISGCVR